MKKVVLIAFVLCTMLATPTFFAAAAEDTTVTGEPVDISCYLAGKEGAGLLGQVVPEPLAGGQRPGTGYALERANGPT